MKKDMSILEAKYEAQKIAFAPLFFQAMLALKKLGILKLIAQNNRGITVGQIAETTGIRLYGVQVLLEAAASANVVEYLDEQTVRLTKVGYILHIDRMTEVNMDFVNDVCYDGAKFLTESIRTGKPEGLKTLGPWKTIYEGLAHLPGQVKKSWFDFDHFYSDDAFPAALDIVFRENPAVLFDIGGNTGKWAFACCRYNPDVRVEIFDLPGQLAVAQKNTESLGLRHRIGFNAIDLLDESQQIPAGADAIWMSQFLDCFSEPEIISILKNVRRAASDKTCVYILEPFIDNQTFEAANYCLTGTSLYFTIMANGNSKMYATGAMTRLVEASGLQVKEVFPLIGDSYHTILKCAIAQP
ncbi:MAG: SAM-dependent methyltransferase [Thermoanaerobaculia bacterium]|nr:SAM-dependent methyltransferase [Thermoanaerobaculia bacterium]